MIYRLLTFFTLFFSLGVAAQDDYAVSVYEGNKAFKKGDFGQASERFLSAVTKDPSQYAGHFNLGNSLYKRSLYNEAAAEYEKALSVAQDETQRANALYNHGNALMALEDFQSAAQLYKQVLKITPYDEEARRNYEIAMLKDKEQQDSEGKQGGGGQGGSDPSKQNEKSEDGKMNNGSSDSQNSGERKSSNPSNNPNPGGMPKEEQEALLNRIEGREQRTARKILNQDTYSMPQSNEKDW